MPSASGPPVENESHSFWLRDAQYQEVEPIILPQTVDICIIGAGISGVSIVYHLMQYFTQNNNKQQSMSVMLLDSRGVCGGATGRNGGIMDAVRKSKDFKYNAFWDVIKTIKHYKMENDIEYEERYNANNDKHEYLPGNINELHPYYGVTFCAAKFIFKLMDIIMDKYKNNFYLQTQTTVHKVSCSDNMHHIEAQHHGKTINVDAKIVVYATNGYTSYLLPNYKHKIYPFKNQIIMTKPTVSNDKLKKFTMGNNWDYGFQRNDGRILFGGGRNSGFASNKWQFEYNDSVHKINDKVTHYLVNQCIRQYIYGDIEIEYVWQGILGFTIDALPFAGPLPNVRNAYICAGFNGSGMAMAFKCGKAIASMITGDSLEWFDKRLLPYKRLNKTSSKL